MPRDTQQRVCRHPQHCMRQRGCVVRAQCGNLRWWLHATIKWHLHRSNTEMLLEQLPTVTQPVSDAIASCLGPCAARLCHASDGTWGVGVLAATVLTATSCLLRMHGAFISVVHCSRINAATCQYVVDVSTPHATTATVPVITDNVNSHVAAAIRHRQRPRLPLPIPRQRRHIAVARCLRRATHRRGVRRHVVHTHHAASVTEGEQRPTGCHAEYVVRACGQHAAEVGWWGAEIDAGDGNNPSPVLGVAATSRCDALALRQRSPPVSWWHAVRSGDWKDVFHQKTRLTKARG